MNRLRGKTKTRSNRGWVYAGIFSIFSFASLIGVLAIVPAVSPSTGAQVADMIRSAAGPQVTANIESVSFWIQDNINQLAYQADGQKPGITLDKQPVAQPTVQSTPVSQPTPQPTQTTNQSTVVAQKPVFQRVAPAPSTNVVTADPQIGWQAYGPNVNGQPAMAQALLNLDPTRPYAGVALVRIDLSMLQLHTEPGFLEPSHATNVVNAIPNLGTIPPADMSHLIAAFNGGFKAVNGKYGMVVDGTTLLTPWPGIATVAIYKDGHVQIGTWGQDLFPGDPNMVALRQNCPPILEAGQIDPRVYVDDASLWGNTIGNQSITWRTGLGITQDGRYLIYAVGNATSVSTLAQALQDAGAYNAMQLDINKHYAHFVTYKPSGNHLTAVQLLDQMENDPTLYLVAHSRDFFYLTTR
ncbi:MAG: phosphodiester glycosidase family protein [Chloroflexi bacterium]|nr:phosphodiester glycosidase family protein [Chloroflexota bacterium]